MNGALFQRRMVTAILKNRHSVAPIYGNYLIINTFLCSNKESLQIVSLALQFFYMRKAILSSIVYWITVLCNSQSLKTIESKRVHFPNGWNHTPVGKSLSLRDLPMNMVVSATIKYIAVTNNGQRMQSLQLIDVKSE